MRWTICRKNTGSMIDLDCHAIVLAENSRLIALFRRLFRGRTDVYPIRRESTSTGKSGYAPACANEWCAGICDKPRIKCGQCGNRLLKKLSDSVYKARASAAMLGHDAGVLCAPAAFGKTVIAVALIARRGVNTWPQRRHTAREKGQSQSSSSPNSFGLAPVSDTMHG